MGLPHSVIKKPKIQQSVYFQQSALYIPKSHSPDIALYQPICLVTARGEIVGYCDTRCSRMFDIISERGVCTLAIGRVQALEELPDNSLKGTVLVITINRKK
jgi:hypothetical protein